MVKTSNAGAAGSIPGWGTKIPHASWPKRKKEKERKKEKGKENKNKKRKNKNFFVV